MKKKYVYGFLTVAVIGIVIAAANANDSQPTEVVCMVAQTEPVQETIQCEGTVEEVGQLNITLGKSVVPEKILVERGERVTEGMGLMEYIEPSLIDSIERLDDEAVLEAFQGIGGIGLIDNYSAYMTGEDGALATLTPETKILTAPADGIVTGILATPNTKSGANDTVMVIATSDSLQVKVNVPENKIADIAIGQRALITGVGFPDTTYPGVVTEISDRASTNLLSTDSTPMVTVYITVLQDEEGGIKPGFTASVQIEKGEKYDTLVVPYEAVEADGNGREYIYLADGNIAQKTYIETAAELANGFEVVSGIESGDQIILDCSRVSNGKRVKPIMQDEAVGVVGNE